FYHRAVSSVLPPSPLAFTFFPYTTLFRSTATMGMERGRMTETKRRSLFAPSSSAASMMLSGTPVWKKVFAMNKFHAETVPGRMRSEEHTSELQSRFELVCRLLHENKKFFL